MRQRTGSPATGPVVPPAENGGGREETDALVLTEPADGEAAGEPALNGAAGNGAEPKDELPAPEELAARIPPEVLAVMDELFRAKWTAVKRLRPGDLKIGGSA